MVPGDVVSVSEQLVGTRMVPGDVVSVSEQLVGTRMVPGIRRPVEERSDGSGPREETVRARP